MNLPVFDLHCDTALELLDNHCRPVERLRKRQGHIDLERGGKLAGYAQLFAFFTTPGMDPTGVCSPEMIFRAMLENLQRELEENRDRIVQARTPAEIRQAVDDGKIAAVFSLEGPAGIGFDPGRLEELAALGFRMTTLTWNESNPLAGSHQTGGGLTRQGKEYVRRAQGYGMALDVSHLSDEGFWDVMDITSGPVCASHSNSRRVYPVSRNLTDEMFRAICQTGGVAGLNLYTGFLGEEPVTLEAACRHVLHWLELDDGKHIALGGDLDGCERLPEGFGGVDDYPALARALADHGVPQPVLEDLFWNNGMRVMESCSM